MANHAKISRTVGERARLERTYLAVAEARALLELAAADGDNLHEIRQYVDAAFRGLFIELSPRG